MSLRIDWSYPALAALMNLHPYEAMAVDRAVIRYAETREGDVKRVAPHFSLRIGAFRVRFGVDCDTDTMNVLYLYRVR